MAKNGLVHEGWKVRRSNATPTKLFSVDSYDLKPISFKFGNDIFINFEMSSSSFLMSFWKINLSLLFRPSVIRGPCLYETYKGQLIKSIIQVYK